MLKFIIFLGVVSPTPEVTRMPSPPTGPILSQGITPGQRKNL